VKLAFEREHPLDRVITDQCIAKYNRMFFFLVKLKRVSQTLQLLWKDLNAAEFRRVKSEEQ